MGVIHGNDILVYVNGVAVAASKSADLDVQVEEIPTSSPTSGDWKTSVTGQKEWRVRCSYLLLDTFADKVEFVGSTVTLRIGVRGSSTDVLEGQAHCLAGVYQMTAENLANGSFTFSGSGALARPQRLNLRTSDGDNLRTTDAEQLTVTG